MAAELVFAPEVEQDLREAFNWYQEHRAGLGEEFLNCVDACIRAICHNPEISAYAAVPDSYVYVRRSRA